MLLRTSPTSSTVRAFRLYSNMTAYFIVFRLQLLINCATENLFSRHWYGLLTQVKVRLNKHLHVPSKKYPVKVICCISCNGFLPSAVGEI